MTRALYAAALVVAPVAIAGCSPYSAIRDPLPPTVAMPDSYGGEAGDSALVDRWWTTFGDEALTAAIDGAVVENFQVRAAWARVRQADTLGHQADSGRWPTISAQLDYSRRRSVLVLPNFTDPSGPQTVRAIENDSFGISMPVAYELDVWDRVGSQVRAAAFDRAASRDDVEALAMTVTANVVEAWLNVVYQRQLRAVLEAQAETSGLYVELLDLRFREGLASALDVLSQRGQAEAIAAQIAAARAQEEIAAMQLAVLLGRAPGAEVVPAERVELPEPPATPSVGVPSDLLVRRPDIRAARRRIEAADERVAAAIADRLPHFNLSGSVGFSSPSLESLFTSFIYSLAAGILAPIFDGERREAVVQQQHAVVWERTEQLAQVMVTALQEVQISLAQERRQLEQIEALERSAATRREALEEARRRFAEGLVPDYVTVLTSLSVAQQAEQQLLAARRQLLSYRVQLHRALGGAWTAELAMPDPTRPVRAEEDTSDDDEDDASRREEPTR